MDDVDAEESLWAEEYLWEAAIHGDHQAVERIIVRGMIWVRWILWKKYNGEQDLIRNKIAEFVTMVPLVHIYVYRYE